MGNIQLVLRLSCLGQSMYRHITPTLNAPDPLAPSKTDAASTTAGPLRQVIPTIALSAGGAPSHAELERSSASTLPPLHPASALTAAHANPSTAPPLQPLPHSVSAAAPAPSAATASASALASGSSAAAFPAASTAEPATQQQPTPQPQPQPQPQAQAAAPASFPSSAASASSAAAAGSSGSGGGNGGAVPGSAFPPIAIENFQAAPNPPPTEPVSSGDSALSAGDATDSTESGGTPPALFYYHQTNDREVEAAPYEYQRTLLRPAPSLQLSAAQPNSTAAADAFDSEAEQSASDAAASSFFSQPAVQNQLKRWATHTTTSTSTAASQAPNTSSSAATAPAPQTDSELPLIHQQLTALMEQIALQPELPHQTQSLQHHPATHSPPQSPKVVVSVGRSSGSRPPSPLAKRDPHSGAVITPRASTSSSFPRPASTTRIPSPHQSTELRTFGAKPLSRPTTPRTAQPSLAHSASPAASKSVTRLASTQPKSSSTAGSPRTSGSNSLSRSSSSSSIARPVVLSAKPAAAVRKPAGAATSAQAQPPRRTPR
jgi:hypothetical protein